MGLGTAKSAVCNELYNYKLSLAKTLRSKD